MVFSRSSSRRLPSSREVFRQGLGTNRAQYTDLYVGDSIARGRTTVDVGVRYDRQGGSAMPSVTQANPAFATLVPGLNFAGYDAPFVWNTISPRAGLTYALDESRKTVARVSYSRFAGQLDTGTIGYTNPTSTAGVAIYPWVDANGDHLAQPNEVNTSQRLGSANGFNPANPTAVTSSNRDRPEPEGPGDAKLRGRHRSRAPAQPGDPDQLYLQSDDRI